MARMNSKTRKRLYPIIQARDGEFCACCGKVGSWKSLCIDHIDNNNRNNALDNLQFLCHSCNTKKNSRGKAKLEKERPAIQNIPSSKEVMLKEIYEPKFREWLEKQVKGYERITVRDAVRAGAEVTGAGLITIERYIEKMCSSAGRFQVVIIEDVKYIEFKEYLKTN